MVVDYGGGKVERVLCGNATEVDTSHVIFPYLGVTNLICDD